MEGINLTPQKETFRGIDTAAQRLIPGLGRFGVRWTATAAALLCVLALGVYAYIQQEIHGEGITGLRTIGAGGATWGLYIVSFVFFVGVSFAGICIAWSKSSICLVELFGSVVLRPSV